MTFQEIVKKVVDDGNYKLYCSGGDFDIVFTCYRNNMELSVIGTYDNIFEEFQCDIKVYKENELMHGCTFYNSNIPRIKYDYINAVDLTEFVNGSGVFDD